MIWDAAAKVNRISFNGMLLKGPDLPTPLSKGVVPLSPATGSGGGRCTSHFISAMDCHSTAQHLTVVQVYLHYLHCDMFADACLKAGHLGHPVTCLLISFIFAQIRQFSFFLAVLHIIIFFSTPSTKFASVGPIAEPADSVQTHLSDQLTSLL